MRSRRRPISGVTDRLDDLPNSWIFGVYFNGELFSSIRVSVLTLGMPDVAARWRLFAISCTRTRPRARSSSIRLASSPIPEKANFPELPYVTSGSAISPALTSMPISGLATVRPEHRAFYRRVFLQETCASRVSIRAWSSRSA